MACAIDATPGGPSANAYCTIAEADTYHDTHIDGATWVAATSDQKCRALVQATRQLDRYVEWDGTASSTTQALAWPRSGLLHPETSGDVDDATIPVRLREACAEQARLLLAGDRAAELSHESQGLKRLAAGSVELEFSLNGGTARTVLAPSAWQMVAPWGLQRQASRGGPVVLERV